MLPSADPTGNPPLPELQGNSTVKPRPVKKMMGSPVRVLYSKGAGEDPLRYRYWILSRLIFSFSVVGFSPRRAAAFLCTPFTLLRVPTMISLSRRSMVS